MTRKRKLILLLTGALGLLLLAGGTYVFFRGNPFRKSADQATAAKKDAVDRTYKVTRDDLVIGIAQAGNVNASQKHKLAMQANFNTKLIWVIDENARVKAGDILARFETDALKEKIENLTIELDNLSKEYEIAQEEEKILISTNAVDLQSAEEKLQQSDDALRKYRRFERVQKRDSLDSAISDAEQKLRDKQDAYTTARDAHYDDDEQATADEKKKAALKTAQQNIDTAQSAMDGAEDNRRVFRRYDLPSKLRQLNKDYEQSQLNLSKVKISVNSKVVQKKRSLEGYRNRIRNTEIQLQRHKEYLPMMQLAAPVDGVVIYGDPDRRWGNLDVKTGIDIYRGQVVITIPEMSNLVVDFDLPEMYRSKVRIGDKVIISPDSLPGEKFQGKISQIATLPVNLVNWDTASPKIYKSRITLDQQSPRLVNGMSVQLNIVTKTIPNTLFVPVEAVFEDNDRFYVFLETSTGFTEQTVKIGQSNDMFVEITDGLDEGDVVYLYRPYQKTQDK